MLATTTALHHLLTRLAELVPDKIKAWDGSQFFIVSPMGGGTFSFWAQGKCTDWFTLQGIILEWLRLDGAIGQVEIIPDDGWGIKITSVAKDGKVLKRVDVFEKDDLTEGLAAAYEQYLIAKTRSGG